jgi:hypothetical protein
MSLRVLAAETTVALGTVDPANSKQQRHAGIYMNSIYKLIENPIEKTDIG